MLKLEYWNNHHILKINLFELFKNGIDSKNEIV